MSFRPGPNLLNGLDKIAVSWKLQIGDSLALNSLGARPDHLKVANSEIIKLGYRLNKLM